MLFRHLSQLATWFRPALLLNKLSDHMLCLSDVTQYKLTTQVKSTAHHSMQYFLLALAWSHAQYTRNQSRLFCRLWE